MTKIPRNIYKRIYDAWGEESQFNMMTEEMGELLQAISKYRRAKTKTEKTHALTHLCEEVADVENMINQFRYMFDSKLIDKFKEDKLKRTLNILDTSKKTIIKKEKSPCDDCHQRGSEYCASACDLDN